MQNRNLMMFISEFLTLDDLYDFSKVNTLLLKMLRADEIWWPLHYREYNFRIVDRKANHAILTYFYCKKHWKELQEFSKMKKVRIGVLGNLKHLNLPDYMARAQFHMFEMFSRPVFRKDQPYEVTAISLPNSKELETDQECIDCFVLCLDNFEKDELQAFHERVLDFFENSCSNFLVIINRREENRDVMQYPEVAALYDKIESVTIAEVTEGDINKIISKILRIARRKAKGKVQVLPELEPPPAPKKTHCEML